jgi:type VI secretion system secreted protein VgrG
MTNKLYGKTLKLKLLDKFADTKVYGELVSVSGYEAISRPFEYKLNLLTQDNAIINKSLCNDVISFALERLIGNEPESERIFNGLIERVNFTKRHNPKNSSNPSFEYSLIVVPKLASLKKIKHSKVFYQPKQQVIKVVEKLLGDYKIDHEIKIKDQGLFIAESCIQYNESDYDFIIRLLQSVGCYYYFKHEKGKHKMVISNQSSGYLDLPKKEVEYVDDDGQILQLDDFCLRYSNHSTEFVVNSFSYTNPEETVEKSYSNTTHKKQEGELLKSEGSAYVCDVQDINQVTKLAENLGISQQLSTEYFKGQSSYLSFIVGYKFKLDGEFFGEFNNKDYVITSLNFSANNMGADYINNFTSIPSSQIFISQIQFTKPIVSGLHFALVVNSDGKGDSQEPYSDDKGNVYIKLLWGKDNNICKANVLSTSNSYSIPRIGSLVYVSFPNNNLYNDIPVIVGMHNQGLLDFNNKEEHYNNVYMTYPATSDKEIYNFISFKDKKEDQSINVHAQKDMILNVEHDEIRVIKNDCASTIKNIRKIVIEEGNDILELNKGDITIETKEGKYTLICKGNVVVQSDNEVNITAKSHLNIKSGGKVTIESKDGILLKTDGDYNSQSGKGTKIETKGAAIIESKGDLSLSGKAFTAKSSTSASYESGTSTSIKSNTQLSLEGATSELKGKATAKVSSPLTKIGM